MRKITTIISIFTLVSMIGACGGGGGNGTPDPNAGFRMQTFAVGPNNVIIPTAGNVQGRLLQPFGSTTGTLETFNRDHSGVGLLIVPSTRVPGRWRLTLGPTFTPGSQCLTFAFVDRDVSLNSVEELFCPGRFAGFTASPNNLDALNPPGMITFNGKGIDSLYGAPTLAFYNEFGYVVASTQVQASQLLRAESEITGFAVAVPDISQAYDGTYAAVVHNINSDGSWEVIGAASITIYGNPPPPPPPPDGGGGCEQPPPGLPQLICEEPQQQ